jgi:2-polyprenyl-3-methyl-5-hydroxy-6-metoxy-1,4-benzoquinol methylase
MEAMTLKTALLERTLVYRMWQAPFAEQKFQPILNHNDLRKVRRVLDVGCGPGINTGHFTNSDYLGIDLNERYVEHARLRHGREFVVADACTYQVAADKEFDFILVNSFLHHVPTPAAMNILSHLQTLLTDDGHIHILELVMPEEPSAAKWLARWDRGKYARTQTEWTQMFAEIFDPVLLRPFRLAAFGVTLWNMLYFKGKARRILS